MNETKELRLCHCNTKLLQKVKLLEGLLKQATDVIDIITLEDEGKYFTSLNVDTDVTEDIKFVIDKANNYFTKNT